VKDAGLGIGRDLVGAGASKRRSRQLLLSAKAPGGWCGSTSDREFPMRRVISIDVCAQIGKT
jgi:hypothetical protein